MKQNTVGLKNFLPLYIIILIDAMAFAMIAPVLSSALVDTRTAVLMLGTSDQLRQMIYGFAIAICPLIALFMAPILGCLSDQAGRRNVLIISSVGLFLGNLLVGVSITMKSLVPLFISRIILGATAASQATAQAAVIDMSTQESKPFNLSMTLLFSSIGFILGPAMGGYLSDKSVCSLFSFPLPFYSIAALSLLNLFLLFFLVKDTRPRLSESIPLLDIIARGGRDLLSAFREKQLRAISLCFLLMQMGWGCFFSFVSIFLIHKHGFSPQEVASFMSVLGVGFCLSYGLILPFIIKSFKFKIDHICTAGLLLTAAGILALIFPAGKTVMWLFPLPIAITVCLAYGTIIPMFSNIAGEERQGWIMGTTTSLVAMAWFASSFIASFIEAFSVYGTMIFTVALFLGSVLLSLGIGNSCKKVTEENHST
ncbi:MAG: MFS transporter [Candidatus Xenobiia bacterium LiM19]